MISLVKYFYFSTEVRDANAALKTENRTNDNHVPDYSYSRLTNCYHAATPRRGQ